MQLIDPSVASKLLIGVFLLMFFALPVIILLLYPPTRDWFRGAIENWDKRLDPEDLNRLARMVSFMFSLTMLGFMIVSSVVIDVEYPTEAWFIIGAIVAGAEGIVIAQILRKK